MGKHNGSFGKQYGRVVGKDADERPGWKGPGYVKKAEAPKKDKGKKIQKIEEEEKEDIIMEPLVPVGLQQQLLNIFRDTFPNVLASDTLQPLLQDVKAALYERDFSRAFGKEEYLEAYSIRWSPSRALCYVSVLAQLQDELAGDFKFYGALKFEIIPQGEDAPEASNEKPFSTMKAVCFGGGAAEVVAFGGFLRFLRDASSRISMTHTDALNELSLADRPAAMDLLLIDSAQWQSVVHKLHNGLTSLPIMPKYSNAAAKAANSPLLKCGDLAATFQQEDVLALSQAQLAQMVEGRTLLTLLFTLNELFTASITKATKFLLSLTLAAESGTLLLVVDSPGSYSEVAVGSEAKKYPMHLLLDHVLLGSKKVDDQTSTASWIKMVSKDAEWFRLPAALQYSIQLENMRYQIHLYRRL